MIDRVHHHTANGRAHAEPAHRTGFAEDAQVVLVVAHLADGGAAIDVNLAHFARLQAHAGIHAFARGELSRAAGTARQLAALADFQLDVVYGAAHRNVPQRQRIARLDRRISTGADLVTGLHALRGKNVA